MNETKLVPTKGQQFFGRRPSFTFSFIYLFIFSPLETNFLKIYRENRKWPGKDVLVNRLSGNISVEGDLSV